MLALPAAGAQVIGQPGQAVRVQGGVELREQRHPGLHGRVQVGGRPAITSSQRIGWDPLAKKLHTWIFDSEGGFAEGIWTRHGNQWIAKLTGTTSDGRASSSTNVVTRVSKDRMTWQSRDRVVGDEVLPNIEEIVIVRTPPQPESPAASGDHNATGEAK